MLFPPSRPTDLMEATTGFEPVDSGFADRRLNHLATSPLTCKVSGSSSNPAQLLYGAEDEIRTRDLLLGKEAF